MRAYSGLMLLMLLVLPHSGMAQNDDALTLAAKQVSDRFVQAAQAKRGEVAEIDDTTLYVSLGSSDGIFEGQLLQIAAKGDPIAVNGEILGYKETPVAVAEVTVVQGERLCLATVKQLVQGQQPAKGNIAYLKSAPPTLAVSSFLRQDAAATAMGTEFSDKLGMALQGTGRFRIVERSRLDAALSELKLGLNDLFDRAKAAPLGQMIQAKGVVMGTITQQNDRYTINVRVVDIETGTQVLTAAVTCGRSTELDGKYGQVGPTSQPTMVKPQVSRLLDVIQPLESSCKPDDLRSVAAGTCMIGGKLYDNCVGYQNAQWDDDFFVFDLRGGNWTALNALIGAHQDKYYWSNGSIRIICDGRVAFESAFPAGSPPKQVSVPLIGVQSLRLELPNKVGHGGFLAVNDIQLVGEGIPAANNGNDDGRLATDKGDAGPMASADALYDPNTVEGR